MDEEGRIGADCEDESIRFGGLSCALLLMYNKIDPGKSKPRIERPVVLPLPYMYADEGDDDDEKMKVRRCEQMHKTEGVRRGLRKRHRSTGVPNRLLQMERGQGTQSASSVFSFLFFFKVEWPPELDFTTRRGKRGREREMGARRRGGRYFRQRMSKEEQASVVVVEVSDEKSAWKQGREGGLLRYAKRNRKLGELEWIRRATRSERKEIEAEGVD